MNLKIPFRILTVTRSLIHLVGSVTRPITYNVLLRSNLAFNLSQRAIATCLASVMAEATSNFTDILVYFM